VPDTAVEGGTIHYETAGDGPPLILLHGIGSNSRSWRRQLTGLSQDFRVIAWDAPGYGKSSDPPPIQPSIRFYADCLYAFLRAISLKDVFLLGHSMGGVIAQEFCRAYSNQVRAVILADTAYRGSKDRLEDRLKNIRTMTPVQLAAERAPKLLTTDAAANLVDEAASIMSEIRPRGYEFAAIALAHSDTHLVLEKLEIPRLLIWGAEDKITPLWNDIPAGIEVEIIGEAGHLCYMEQPERFNEIVRDFLARNLRPRRNE
jgi:pimeloyl-ACP methyl ester carboxylesterase